MTVDQPVHPDGQRIPLSANQVTRATRIVRWRQAGLSNRNTMSLTMEFDAMPDAGSLRMALADLLRRHTNLRTLVRHDGTAAHGVLVPITDPPLVVLDPSDDPLAQIRMMAAQDLDLSIEPGFQVLLAPLPGDGCLLCLAIDHIHCDGASLLILAADLTVAYSARLCGKETRWTQPAAPYHTFAEWEQSAFQGPDLERRLAYWSTRIDPLEIWPEFRLPGAVEPDLDRRTAGRARRRLAGLADRLMDAADDFAATPYCLIATAVTTVMSRLGGHTVVGMVSPVDARPPAWRRTVGWFARMTPIRVRVDSHRTVAEAVTNMRETVQAAVENSVPPPLLLGHFARRDHRSRRWRPRVFLNVDYEARVTAGLSLGSARLVKLHDSGGEGLGDGIAVEVSIGRQDVDLIVQYEMESLSEERAEAFLCAVIDALRRMLDEPDLPLRNLLNPAGAP